jgi:hypothetical protein
LVPSSAWDHTPSKLCFDPISNTRAAEARASGKCGPKPELEGVREFRGHP